MKLQSSLAAPVLMLLMTVPGSPQSAADLLQKGIYAQETAGDLDGALRIFRQVAGSATSDKRIAAQAQYQIVLCLLQRGDRPAAAREVELLARNFPDQPDLLNRARKLLPGGPTILPPPWGESECSQLNIKRDGQPTGDTLYYSVDQSHAGDNTSMPLVPNEEALRWELTTRKTNRSVMLKADRTTGQVAGQPTLRSDDYLGDPAVEPLAGPAIDIQGSVFAIRRLPLAVGYKTTLTILPLALSHVVPQEVELAVPAIEQVEVTAGKFKCYKVAISPLGQTFWFGVEGSRPLVKFKSGNTEAELVKLWGAENFIESELAFFTAAGWKLDWERMGPGPDGVTSVTDNSPVPQRLSLNVNIRKVYTPAAEIPQALRAELPQEPYDCRPETIRTREIGGQQALSCVINGEHGKIGNVYKVWIRSTGASIELSGNAASIGLEVWQVDRVLATAKRIP